MSKGRGIILSLAALGAGLGLGAALTLAGGGPEGAQTFFAALPGSFLHLDALGLTLFRTGALILTALSAAAAFRGGLMNLGGPGQYWLGAFCALYGAAQWQMNWWQALALGAAAGGIWAAGAGMLRAGRQISEGIASMVMNWIALYLVNFCLAQYPAVSEGAAAAVPEIGFLGFLGVPYWNWGLPLALIIALILWAFFRWSTAGYEIRILGLNRRAARYAGMHTKRATVLLMALSGALAGLGGGAYYLSQAARMTQDSQIPLLPFLGMAAALLGANHPLALVPWAILLSGVQTAAAGARLNVDAVSALCAGAALVCAWAPRLMREKTGRGERA